MVTLYRRAMEQLQGWKRRESRKPLVIRGARQVGKTWLMREFGATAYRQAVYINFEESRSIANLFTQSSGVERILTGLELFAGHKIDPADTLLIFDEMQQAPGALACLGAFQREAPQYQIVCASSDLDAPFPVARMETLDLHPLSFYEFLQAVGKERYVELLEEGRYDLAPNFQRDYVDLLKDYLYIGGMPEVVDAFARNRDFGEAREIQQRILTTYDRDFSRYVPNEITPRVRLLWNSIPRQLDRENKKLTYRLIREGTRAREYERALRWLSASGLVHEVHRATVPELPLEEYEDPRALKLFFLDVGLLGCLLGLRQDLLLEGDAPFTAYHGALLEQYVLQELVALNKFGIYYWTAEWGASEVDFLLDSVSQVIPVEVAARENLQAKKLKVYREKFEPRLAVRASLKDYRRVEGLLHLPLWAVASL